MKKMLFSFFFLFSVALFAQEIALQEIECSIRPFNRLSKSIGVKERDSSLHISKPHQPLIEGTSTNWSGYVALTSLSKPVVNTVSKVTGSWTVPALSLTPNNTYSSVWVGIDGYGSNTVEQIGTEHDWSNGSQSNYAWFEMYPQGSYEIIGFPVNIGDHIGATVSFQGKGIFLLTLNNYTKNVTFTVPTSYTKSTIAQRKSAEWVVEAPSISSVLPLADFNNIVLSGCKATIKGITGPINSVNWVHDALTMVTQNNVIKAIPSGLTGGGQNFSVTWKHE